MGEARSRPIDVTSGVPQGSNLGPLLFALFVNDLCGELKDYVFLFYADDLKIYKAVSLVLCCDSLQLNLRIVHQWCLANRMRLNISKCRAITFSRRALVIRHDYSLDSELVTRSEAVNDLGVLVDLRLTFKFHVNQVVS